MPSDHWYILQLRPGGLERAVANLKRQHVTSFMPTRTYTQRRANRLVNVERPLFPGYLFAQIGPTSPPWRTINSTYGVAKAVCLHAGAPTPVPEEFMESMLAFDDAQNGTETGDHYSVGETVRVVSGPFAAFLARVDAVPEKDRIYVLLDMMGRVVRTEVKASDLEPAHAP